MALDPVLAGGYRGVEIPNALQQYAQVTGIQNAMQEQRMRALQMQQLQEEGAARNALAQRLQSGQPLTVAEAARFGKSGYDVLTAQRLAAEAEGKQKKADADLVASYVQQARDQLPMVNDPQTYTAWRAQTLQRLPGFESFIPPEYSPEIVGRLAMGADKMLEQHFVTQDIGGATRTLTMPKYAVPGKPSAATVVPGSEAVKTLTPSEAKPTISNVDVGGAIITQEYNPVTRTTRVLETRPKSLTPEQARAAKQEETKVAHTTTDEAGNVTLYNMFGKVIGAKDASGAPVAIKGKPSATFEKTRAQREQLSKDLNTAIFELKNAAKEGGLIDQSTGSGVGRAVDVGARVFGTATEGDIAIGKLKPIADVVLKMVPRFEGPQSDKDTQSYKEAAGQLADPGLPRAIRKAAAQTIIRLMENRKGQFVSSDMASEGAGAAGGVDVNNPLLK